MTTASTGYVIVTKITDKDGRDTFQHSQIFRDRAEAERRAAHVRELHIWERAIEREVQTCRTFFEEDTARASESYVPAIGRAA